jgi:hypothetical protein
MAKEMDVPAKKKTLTAKKVDTGAKAGAGKGRGAGIAPTHVPSTVPAPKAWDVSKIKHVIVLPDTKLDRVHPDKYGAAQFNPSTDGDARFSPIKDSAGNIIPTIYAAETFEAALMETIFHDVPNKPGKKIVRNAKLADKHHASLKTTEPLMVVDATSVGLKNTNATKAEVIESPPDKYPHSRRFAEDIHAQYPDMQGIRWVSKQDDRAMAYVFFGDRIKAGTFMPIIEKQPIMEEPDLAAVLDLADQIDVLIAD